MEYEATLRSILQQPLLTIVNGNTQHRINVEHAELGGIVYRINQLVASLTGEGDEGDEGGGDG